MKEIPLTRGYVAIVDDCDYEYLMQWKWHATSPNAKNSYIYAARRTAGRISGVWQQKQLGMHRVVMELAGFDLGSYVVDHKNGNTLLNIRTNLRLATNGQNVTSAHKPTKNKTGYRGVCKRTDVLKVSYTAEIMFEQKKYKLGTFATPEDAALAYNEAAIRLYGEFAWQNVIPSTNQQSAA